MRKKIYNVIKGLQRGNVSYSDAVDKLCDLHSVLGSAKQLEGFGEDLTRVYYVKCSECGCDHNDNGNEYCCGCGRKFE